jgi:hypothetical protein
MAFSDVMKKIAEAGMGAFGQSSSTGGDSKKSSGGAGAKKSKKKKFTQALIGAFRPTGY